MKKLIFLSFFVVVATGFTFAQEARFGFKGGLNLASVSYNKAGEVKENSMTPSFNVGVFADLPMIGEMLSFQPGFFYTGKGTQATVKNDAILLPTDMTLKSNVYYLEGQANILFKIPLESFKVFVGAGPYIAYGVNGKYSIDGKILGLAVDEKKDIIFTTEKGNIIDYTKIKPWDVGATITAGIEFGNIQVSANYGLGFIKIHPTNTDNNTDNAGKNRVLSASVGILF